MRHVRILGVCLAAVFAVSAVAVTAALASTGLGEYSKFLQCPFNAPPFPGGFERIQACDWAQSSSGAFYQAGNVTVHMTKPVLLQGGFEENEAEELQWVGTENGYLSLSKVAEPAPGLTEGTVDTSLLSPTELARYEKFVGEGKTKVTATIELAGPPTDIILNESHLLLQNGTALGLPVQVKLSNPFLGKNCYIGSNSNPIKIELTTGKTSPPPPNEPIEGSPGELRFTKRGVLVIHENKLVNNSFAAPGVIGCGISGGANAALNSAIGLPSPEGHNTAVIEGQLAQVGAEQAQENGA